MLQRSYLAFKVLNHLNHLSVLLLTGLTFFMTRPDFILKPLNQILHFPLLKFDLTGAGFFRLVSKMALLELIAEILNFRALIDNSQLEVRAFTLQLLNQCVALRNFLFLLSHDLYHEVFLLTVFSVSMRTTRLLVLRG